MAKKKAQQFFTHVMAGIAWVTVLLLSLCSLSTCVHPKYVPFAGTLSLAFPFFLFGVLFVFLVILLVSRRLWWIPVAGLVLNVITIRDYFPVNIPSPAPKNCLKVISYNCMGYGRGEWIKDSNGVANGEHMAHYLAQQEADIICLQEADARSDYYEKNIVPVMRKNLPYRDTIRYNGTSSLAVWSRYPIARKQILSLCGNNSSGLFVVVLGAGDSLYVINNHLRSLGLSEEDRTAYSDMVHGKNDTVALSSMEEGTFALIQKINTAYELRAGQVDEVADFVEKNKDKNILLCGDFNDTPVSYAHHRLGKHLKDCFVSTGNGLGRSYNKYAMLVRIDHILCSSRFWKPYSCYIDADVNYSDHYPVICHLQRVMK